MRYAIQVNSSPYHANTGLSAYRFIEAALAQGHKVCRVFFYHEGIYHAFADNTPPDDELQLTKLWGKLAIHHSIDLLVCISAAQRRGLLSNEESALRNKNNNGLAEGFRIGGLGQWLETLLTADRVLVFG